MQPVTNSCSTMRSRRSRRSRSATFWPDAYRSTRLHDRIVLVGVAADSVKDDFYTPLGRWLWQAPAKMSGVELHAHIADQLLRFALEQMRPMSSWSGAAEQLWILFWALTGALAGLAAPSARRLGWVWIMGSISIAAASYGAFLAGVWVPFIPGWLGWLGATGLVTAYLAQTERRERQVLHDLFASHVSADVANLLWERRGELIEQGSLKPQSVTATTLFVDLRGFTSISERLLPDDLMKWLNRALEAFTRTILDHNGMIDDYFGDGIKANFGVLHSEGGEDPVGADARRAVECARALARVTAELNAKRGAGANAVCDTHRNSHRCRRGRHGRQRTAPQVHYGRRCRQSRGSVADAGGSAPRRALGMSDHRQRHHARVSRRGARRLAHLRPCG